MIEISDQSVLYLGVGMFSIFLIATIIEFRNMSAKAEARKLKLNSGNKKKVIPIKRMKVSNY